ncbi:DUF6163 family protein [Notoacmeibacter sp. MSK16QG-6]|uniref:DUF6163 family protein n=1 Tax=Notoacmeibacter sp. MSK16QG-6 TaxID=2957982 RepID=UPI00209EAE01|nr:DUF6163 family protein [Notoacmeibacter sp. MSK16QG-6]MCP1198463.1 DUF6163 family protein [Notoacmeibacter sp. MSK16QG-6]
MAWLRRQQETGIDEVDDGRLDDAGAYSLAKPSLSQNGYVVFLRLLAVIGMVWGIGYWLRLIGWHEATEWRFDRMSVSWRVAASTLAVLYPFAASGLWMLASWGVVLWFSAAAMELTMYVVFPDVFGSRPLNIALHILIAVLYAAWRLYMAHEARSRRIVEVEQS